LNTDHQFYEEIEHVIKRYEVNKKAREISTNYEQIETAWNIGRLLVEAQGGQSRAKYGNALIKEWSEKLTKLYGKGYNLSNLKYFRQFYLTFPKGHPVVGELSWSHYLCLLPIKDENKRNYYINKCIERSLSKRALIQEIKSNSYERLIDKPAHIDIINTKNNNSITPNMHNPIILYLNENEKVTSEKDLEILILSKLSSFFSQLGQGFALIGNQYKIHVHNNDYYIDLLLFNYELNLFVVVELKNRELQKIDKGQVELYMNLVDENIKKPFHNKTVGIIITKEQDKFIANFISQNNNIIPLTYELQKEGIRDE